MNIEEHIKEKFIKADLYDSYFENSEDLHNYS